MMMPSQPEHLMYELRLFYVCNKVMCLIITFEVAMKYLCIADREWIHGTIKAALGNE